MLISVPIIILGPHLVLMVAVFSEVPGCPPAHLPAVAEPEVMAFVVITLAAASVVIPVTAMAVTVTAQAACVADSAGTRAAMCGATGALTMGP
jgi:hypothetical protein